MRAKYAGPDGRRAFVERILSERPECQANLECCTGGACDVHEILARSAGGSILDDENVLALCRACHDWIGNHPKEALAKGLRKSRYPGRNPEGAE
jgi:5-methylcytosine-specific restriction endonuclease McrA